MISPASPGLDSHIATIFFEGNVLPRSRCFRRHRLSHLSRQRWGGEYETMSVVGYVGTAAAATLSGLMQ